MKSFRSGSRPSPAGRPRSSSTRSTTARASSFEREAVPYETSHFVRHPRPAAAGGGGASENRRRHSPRRRHQQAEHCGRAAGIWPAVCCPGQQRQGVGGADPPRPHRHPGGRDLLYGPQQKGGPGGPGRGRRGGVRPLPQVSAGEEGRPSLAEPRLLRPPAVPSGDHHDDGGDRRWRHSSGEN